MNVIIDGEPKHFRTVWMENGLVKMIEQHLLPQEFKIVEYRNHMTTAGAITDMTTRGAGAVGATGAFAMAQAVHEAVSYFNVREGMFEEVLQVFRDRIKKARPTANALFVGVDHVYDATLLSKDHKIKRMLAMTAAQEFADADSNSCKTIGEHGADLIEKLMKEKGLEEISIMTHCNAGWLAFVDYGSALSPIYEANRRGIKVKVFTNETRPYNQGSRLTAWELKNEGIDVEIVTDNQTGALMTRNLVDMVIVGADRIAANGDTANKVGTYMVATMADRHEVPFYVAAPKHTFDFNSRSGKYIPIEERTSDEVNWVKGVDRDGNRTEVRFATEDVPARYIAFDVTPHYMVKEFITDHGVLRHWQLPDKLAENPKEVIAHYGRIDYST